MTRAVQIAELGDQNVFTIDGDNNRVGIGSTQPTVKLDVGGVVVATAFTGDGTGLTGVASTDNIITGTAATFNNVVKVGTAITLDATSGIVTATGVNVTGVATASKFDGDATGLTGSPSINVTNITASGTLTYEDVTNVDSIGIVTARSGLEIGASGVGGTITAVGNVEIAGIMTATEFHGSGANLTNLPSTGGGGAELDVTASLFI